MKIVKIKWVDACQHEEISFTDIEKYPVKHFLAQREHYGTIIKEDDDGIIIAHDKGETSYEILAIPKSMYEKVDNNVE